MESSHQRSTRPRASDIAERYRIDETLAAPEPGVVDDLLTSGAHFRAAKRVLRQRFAGIEAVGLFLARRVPATTVPEAVAGRVG